VPGYEVAPLVEDAVVRKEDLVVHGFDRAIVEKRRRVEDVAFLVDEADHRRYALRRPGDEIQLGDVVAHE